MPLLKHRSLRGISVVAWTLSLLLHGMSFVGFRSFRALPAADPARNPEPLEVSLLEVPADDPSFYTELPPDRQDQAPEKADFLSNVTSRARDQAPGGESSLPRMTGEGNVPQVTLEPRGEPAPSDPAPPDPEPATASPPSASSPAPGDPVADRRAREQSLRQLMPRRGESDIPQPEMAYAQGNAPLAGDVSLSTTAWNWAPWLQRFRRDLMDHWFAPSAYYLGMLREGGWAVVEVEIDPSGELKRLDLLQEEGHPSLARAAVDALESMAPMEALPADFPENVLTLRIRMEYPKVRSR